MSEEKIIAVEDIDQDLPLVMHEYEDATIEEIEEVMQKAWEAASIYRKYSLKQRADFMRAIATALDDLGDELLKVAGEETHLPEARLRSERARTQYQLRSYADACERGDWLDVRIDTVMPDKNPPRPDLRKTLVPLGPVVVFGASNFPFAYSTAGGDTACALAAGCPVVVKAHPAHAHTSELVAQAILAVAQRMDMPEGVFAHVHGKSIEVGKALVEHPYTKAVGFTGSYAGGRQLFDWANNRKEPIPVFAEMGSVNPVFLLPEKLKESAASIATQYAGSITLGVGQFCTNPGLLVAIKSEGLEDFLATLKTAITQTNPGVMLHAGIYKNYVEKRANALAQEGVDMEAVAEKEPQLNEAAPTIATVAATTFINNPVLHQEVFGPFSLIVVCNDMNEMMEVAHHLEGQLTTTLIATDKEIMENTGLVEELEQLCGRFVLNSVPTGVEVSLAMQHGGPFPATTDSRFTSVGPDGIKRFARPLLYQNWPERLLPEELKNKNTLKIWRTVNDKLTDKSL